MTSYTDMHTHKKNTDRRISSICLQTKACLGKETGSYWTQTGITHLSVLQPYAW